MIERASGQSHGGHWTNPGGSREPGETTIANALRELLEETGIDLTPIPLADLLGTFIHAIPGDDSALIEAFYFRYSANVVMSDLKSDEASDAAWVPIDDPNLPLQPGGAIQLAYLQHHILPELDADAPTSH
jgi:8-oxo-dGTP pyrophosphatase MutT (NUDIX family)